MTDESTPWSDHAFASFFERGTGGYHPHPWQMRLARRRACPDQLIKVPTGLGKTLGVLAAWAFHKLELNDGTWPTRLVWALPMRSLTEQTAQQAKAFLEASGFDDTPVHILMGGNTPGAWVDRPCDPAIIVGTQDLLLSAALNRGYGTWRAAWPRAFGLLNVDSLWIMDEVQLMGVGLITSAQLQAFASQDVTERFMPRPRATWWMSATLRSDWLDTPDTQPYVKSWIHDPTIVPESEWIGDAWSARKPLQCVDVPVDDHIVWAARIAEGHARQLKHETLGRRTIVVVNRVSTACAIHDALEKIEALSATDIRLVHSRFRHGERAEWSTALLRDDIDDGALDRIIVSTQIIEAGVDVSATHLVSELAPWSSLVQRFGRAARRGGMAEVVVLVPSPRDEKNALPYAATALDAASEALLGLDDVGLESLSRHEASLPLEKMAALYPYSPAHVVLRRELDELFDTTADLAGTDIDIGRFVRDESVGDVAVFWRQGVGSGDATIAPDPAIQPAREELCRVPLGSMLDDWVKATRSKGALVHRWSFRRACWVAEDRRRISPGTVLLADTLAGGYDPVKGFLGKAVKNAVSVWVVEQCVPQGIEVADRSADGDAASRAQDDTWQTIAWHGKVAAERVGAFTDETLDPSLRSLLDLALRVHDWGKAHPAFAASYRCAPHRADLAKAPSAAWAAPSRMYDCADEAIGKRPGFRHELASMLALLDFERDRLVGVGLPRHSLEQALRQFGLVNDEHGAVVNRPTNALSEELKELTSTDIDLLLYLVLAHHGKLRATLLASSHDVKARMTTIRGVQHGDVLPATRLYARDGTLCEMPAVTLSLDLASMGYGDAGRSWTLRVGDLLQRYGPFSLAWLEALVRAADASASAAPGEKPDPDLDGVQLEPVDPASLVEPSSAHDTGDIATYEVVDDGR